jgi:tRNA(Ile)-lysidine synthase
LVKTLKFFLLLTKIGKLPREVLGLASFSNNFQGLWSIAEHKLRGFSLENQRFALGVSGGADSIGLFHVFSSFLKQKKISDLVIFHINFGLRGAESDGDEAFVRSICAAENIALDVFHAQLAKGAGVQEKARDFRREIQSDYIDKGFIVALAHNADDLAENVLMRLARGTSLENAAGMGFWGGKVFRPWLEVSRDMIRQSLKDVGHTWREDSSNELSIYARNQIRQTILPHLEALFPGASKRLGASFLAIKKTEQPGGAEVHDAISMTQLAESVREALCKQVHDFISSHYGARSPVPRQVIYQIASAIYRISSGLDGEGRTFQLPENKNLSLSRSEMRISYRK